MRISDWSSDVCSSDLTSTLKSTPTRPSRARRPSPEGYQRAVPYEIVTVEREDVTEVGIAAVEPDPVATYQEASPTRPGHLACELHEAPRGALCVMAEQKIGRASCRERVCQSV